MQVAPLIDGTPAGPAGDACRTEVAGTEGNGKLTQDLEDMQINFLLKSPLLIFIRHLPGLMQEY